APYRAGGVQADLLDPNPAPVDQPRRGRSRPAHQGPSRSVRRFARRAGGRGDGRHRPGRRHAAAPGAGTLNVKEAYPACVAFTLISTPMDLDTQSPPASDIMPMLSAVRSSSSLPATVASPFASSKVKGRTTGTVVVLIRRVPVAS